MWFFSQRKKGQDAMTRANWIEKIRHELNKLHARLQSPKTRFRTREKVQEAVEKTLSASPAGRVIAVDIETNEIELSTIWALPIRLDKCKISPSSR